MKKLYIIITAALVSVSLFSCKKNGIKPIGQDIDVTTPQIKYFNFSVGSPSVNFYANGTKVSAIVSATGAESTTGTAFGSVYPASNYSLIQAGQYTFGAQIPSTATANANKAIATLQATIEQNKHYSLYLSGVYNSSALSTDAFILEDKLPAANSTIAYVRFVNTISNATAPFDLYIKNTTTNTEALVASGVAYKSASQFVAVPFGQYELYARYASAPTTNVIIRNGTTNGNVSFAPGRVYTIATKGSTAVTTGSNAPSMDFTSNP